MPYSAFLPHSWNTHACFRPIFRIFSGKLSHGKINIKPISITAFLKHPRLFHAYFISGDTEKILLSDNPNLSRASLCSGPLSHGAEFPSFFPCDGSIELWLVFSMYSLRYCNIDSIHCIYTLVCIIFLRGTGHAITICPCTGFFDKNIFKQLLHAGVSG